MSTCEVSGVVCNATLMLFSADSRKRVKRILLLVLISPKIAPFDYSKTDF